MHGKNAEKWGHIFIRLIGGKRVGVADTVRDSTKANRKMLERRSRRMTRSTLRQQVSDFFAQREEEKLEAQLRREMREFAELVGALNEPW